MELLLIASSAIALSLTSLIGLTLLPIKRLMVRGVMLALVSFSAGALLGAAFLHLMPEAWEVGGANSLSHVLFGVIAFFLLERFLYWRHCHDMPLGGGCSVHSFVYLNLLGDGIHNFLDGMTIGASYRAGIPLGLTATLAIALHEIPQEIGDFSVLLYGGLTKRRALAYNFLSQVTCVAGALLIYAYSHLTTISILLLSVAAGGFIYIASSDLIPELHKERDLRRSFMEVALMVAGVLLMLFLKALPEA